MTESISLKRINRKSILMPSFKSLLAVEFEKILYIKAMQNYTRIHMVDGQKTLASISFGKLLDQLKSYGLCQCHKSYAINRKYVVAYHKSGKIELQGDVMVPVSRRRKKFFLFSLEFDNQFL